jgi:hypothetical protein
MNQTKHVMFGILMTVLALGACGRMDSQNENSIKRDHAAISKVLDSALLSPSPLDSFRVALPKVKAYPTVEKAWIDGLTFFVQYKQGGVVSWTVPPPTKEPTIKGE